MAITSNSDNLNLRGTSEYRTGLNAPAIASGQLEGQGYVECASRALWLYMPVPRKKWPGPQWNDYIYNWDTFVTSNHNNSEISTINKFNYFNSLLEGPAARSIHGLPLTDANYEAAIGILKDRFLQPQQMADITLAFQIISANMDELLKLPGCNDDRANILRFFYDKVIVYVRGLQSSN